jgi:hypothetical protein
MGPGGISQGGTQPGGFRLPGDVPQGSAWDPNGVALEALRSVVAAYGPDALDDERSLSNRLLDVMGPETLPRERNLLLAAARHRSVAEIRERLTQGVGLDAAVRLVSDRLNLQEALDPSGTIWALGTMARALGLNASAPESAPSGPPSQAPFALPPEPPYTTEPLAVTQTVSVAYPLPQSRIDTNAVRHQGAPQRPPQNAHPVRTNRKLVIAMVVLVVASGATGASLALFTGSKTYTGPPANAVPSQVFTTLKIPSDLLTDPLSESSKVVHDAPADTNLATIQNHLPSSCKSFVYWLFGPVNGYSSYDNTSETYQSFFDIFEELQLVPNQPDEASDFGEFENASARACIAMAYSGTNTNQPAASTVSIPSPPSGVSAQGLEAFPTTSLRLTIVLVCSGRIEVFLQWTNAAASPAPDIGPAVSWVEDETAQLASK